MINEFLKKKERPTGQRSVGLSCTFISIKDGNFTVS